MYLPYISVVRLLLAQPFTAADKWDRAWDTPLAAAAGAGKCDVVCVCPYPQFIHSLPGPRINCVVWCVCVHIPHIPSFFVEMIV